MTSYSIQYVYNSRHPPSLLVNLIDNVQGWVGWITADRPIRLFVRSSILAIICCLVLLRVVSSCDRSYSTVVPNDMASDGDKLTMPY